MERPAHTIQLLIGARAQECECGYFPAGSEVPSLPSAKVFAQTTLKSRIAPDSRARASPETTESETIAIVGTDVSETAAGERARGEAPWADGAMTAVAHVRAARKARSHKVAVFMVFISPH